MSQIAKESSSTSLRTQYRASSSSPTKLLSKPGGPSRLRVPGSAARSASPVPLSSPSKVDDGRTSPLKGPGSLKEQIALKRAEAKKAQLQRAAVSVQEINEHSDPFERSKKEYSEVLEVGRWSVRETISRARNTGNLNLSSRSLVCIPSCLFEIHLGITPEPLKTVTEPDYPSDDNAKRERVGRQEPSWFDSQDLMVLKARMNEIAELQSEVSLFGSLKVIDLHCNRLSTVPQSLATLSVLTTLDLSNNRLQELHPAIFSLPALTTLDLSHNELTALPFSQFDRPLDSIKMPDSGAFFTPDITRSNVPLPKLRTLDVSYNKLSGSSIDHDKLPAAMTHLTLSYNPLKLCAQLLTSIAKLTDLQELHMKGADIDDESLTRAYAPMKKFSRLRLLDLSETKVSRSGIRKLFDRSGREENLNFDVSTSEPALGELRVIVGKLVVKEAWEIEAEQNYLRKKKSSVALSGHTVPQADGKAAIQQNFVEKEQWEIDVEKGLLTAGGRRKARVATIVETLPQTQTTLAPLGTKRVPLPTKPVEREAWEIEAELGLLTEGGRRRARAQAAAATATNQDQRDEEATKNFTDPASSSSLANYYATNTQTMKLPGSAPPSRSHARSFSLAITPQKTSRPDSDLMVPSSTVPLSIISKQSFATTLRILVLNSRRADPSFSLPSEAFIHSASSSGGLLPNLDELYLEGCGLSDLVTVIQDSPDTEHPTASRKENIFRIILSHFPSLSVLDLSYNALTSESLIESVLSSLLIPPQSSTASQPKKGLKVLRLRGNRLTDLTAIEQVAELFKGNRQVSQWRLEELDLRENEISKLPPMIGLLPLDVFLVEGNTFRIPPRKVWEREGTKGLLSWLRGRVE